MLYFGLMLIKSVGGNGSNVNFQFNPICRLTQKWNGTDTQRKSGIDGLIFFDSDLVPKMNGR